MQFTTQLHHVDLDRLRAAYRAINPKAAAGVDEVTWQEYGQDLEVNLRDLHGRVHRGSFKAKPLRRTYIPKADGRLRPLGIASLEDKIVQSSPAPVWRRAPGAPVGRPTGAVRPSVHDQPPGVAHTVAGGSRSGRKRRQDDGAGARS